MKKLVPLALGTSLLLLFTACSAKPSVDSVASSKATSAASQTSGENLANPFVDCADMNEAYNVAGFLIAEPAGLPTGYTRSAIRAIKGEMIELIYTSGEDEIRLRAAVGESDISGDYNTYDESQELTVNDHKVTAKGNGGSIMVATWSMDDHSFSITSTAGIPSAVVEDIVKSLG